MLKHAALTIIPLLAPPTENFRSMKIQPLNKEGVHIDSSVLSTEEDPAQVAKLRENVEDLVRDAYSLQLNDNLRHLSDSVIRSIVHQTEQLYKNCCRSWLTYKEVNTKNIGQLYRAGLKNP